MRRLSAGRTPATTSVIPSWDATASAVSLLSPVTMTTRRPSARSCSTAAGGTRLERIGHAEQSDKDPVHGDIDDRLSLAAAARRHARSARRSRPRASSAAPQSPRTTWRPSTRPVTHVSDLRAEIRHGRAVPARGRSPRRSLRLLAGVRCRVRSRRPPSAMPSRSSHWQGAR